MATDVRYSVTAGMASVRLNLRFILGWILLTQGAESRQEKFELLEGYNIHEVPPTNAHWAKRGGQVILIQLGDIIWL